MRQMRQGSVLEFRKLTLDCIKTLKPFFENNECRICDCTVGGTFMWRDYHRTEYAIEDEVLYLKVAYPETGFAPPRGVDAGIGSYEKIIEYCSDNGIPTKILAVSETVHERICGMCLPGFYGSTAIKNRRSLDVRLNGNAAAGFTKKR